MKRLFGIVFLLLLAVSAQAEIQSINITIFGMD
jgi:hypothetical protein